VVAAVVYASDGYPVTWWPLAVAWLALLALLSFLMVSTWRYYSFKGINLSKPYTPLIIIVVATFIYAIWNYAQPVLLVMATCYMASGIVIRLGGMIRRRFKPAPMRGPAEHPVG